MPALRSRAARSPRPPAAPAAPANATVPGARAVASAPPVAAALAAPAAPADATVAGVRAVASAPAVAASRASVAGPGVAAILAAAGLLVLLVLLPASGCRPPTKDELTAETDALFAKGMHKTALKQLVVYMRRNPGEVVLRTRRLDYLVKAGGIGAVLADRTDDKVAESVKPSRDAYKGFLISWVEQGLSSEDPAVRSAAVGAMADLGRGGAGADVDRMLAAGGAERATAIRALAALGSADAYERLAKELGKPDVDPALFEVAVPQRSPVPRILGEAIESKDAAIRAGALLAFAHAGVQGKHMASVTAKLGDPDGGVRGAACRALSSARDSATRAAIEKVLAGDPDPRARAGAAAGLGVLFDHDSIPALWTAFADKAQPAEVRAEAAFSLSGFRCSDEDPEAKCLTGTQAGAIKAARRDPAFATHREIAVLAAAELLDPGTRPLLKDLLLSDSQRVRDAAAKLLWQFDDKTVDGGLGDLLKAAADEATALKVLRAFEAWQSQELAPMVVDLASTEAVPAAVRAAAVNTMTRLGFKGREAAVGLFTSSAAPEWLRLAAAEASRTTIDAKNEDDEALVADLVKASANMAASASPALRAMALRMLMRFGDAELLAPIEAHILGETAKPVEPEDKEGGAGVPPQHAPLLVHQVAAVAKGL